MSIRDVAVIVQENPIHVVEVRTGIQGKRGPQGDEGPAGPQGIQGPQGPAGKELDIVITSLSVIDVDGADHGKHYICTNESSDNGDNTVVVVGYSEETIEGDDIETKGKVIIFTQASSKTITLTKLNPDIDIISEGTLNTFKQGSTVALVSTSRNSWVLVGSVGLEDEIIP